MQMSAGSEVILFIVYVQVGLVDDVKLQELLTIEQRMQSACAAGNYAGCFNVSVLTQIFILWTS